MTSSQEQLLKERIAKLEEELLLKNRELEIEAALEKVRSRSLTMHKSDELQEVVNTVCEQLKELNIEMDSVSIAIFTEGRRGFEYWIASPVQFEKSFLIDDWDFALVQAAINAKQNGEEFFSKRFTFEEKNAWFNFAFEHTSFSRIPADRRKYILEAKAYAMSIAHSKNTGIQINDYSGKLPSASEIEILKRFARVFEQAYIRFLDLQKAEAQAKSIEYTLTELKATQSQLIQSEKMASLGELTAGIAHEIQNPLNFVNNFSEINAELSDELHQEAAKGNIEEVQLLARDIKANSEKINSHGKRADAIVKGMLQHSRNSGGQKEPTDINSLADEYLRLSYHGLRAKDSSFNARMATDFDHSIGKIKKVVQQDMARVLLNLYNNAFYAVSERQKQNLAGYEPTVSVSTKRTADKIMICVSDNGNGIPKNIVDKIFQPFFTTKPTGQGTGLGLSLSYDIVKAHGGELKVAPSEGAKFIIQLPID